jgi:hypothetical protein
LGIGGQLTGLGSFFHPTGVQTQGIGPNLLVIRESLSGRIFAVHSDLQTGPGASAGFFHDYRLTHFSPRPHPAVGRRADRLDCEAPGAGVFYDGSYLCSSAFICG